MSASFSHAQELIARSNQSGHEFKYQITGDIAYKHVQYLSEDIGARVAGSSKEGEARDYIVQEFEKMGYKIEVQPFSYVRNGQTFDSANVIATKEGTIDQTVLIGAHYDTVSSRSEDGQTLTGAGDNASGVGVLLETAAVLANYKTKEPLSL